MALRQVIRDATPVADWTRRWFDLEQAARLIVDDTLVILAANARATRILTNSTSLSQRDGRIVLRHRGTGSELLDLVGEMPEGAVRSRIISAHNGDAVLVRAQLLNFNPTPIVGLWLRDLGEEIELDCADLEPLFGLTRTEQAVLVKLMMGMSSQEIARALTKSVLTVRTHIKRIYLKLHVSNREQMFARALPFIFIR